MGGIFSRIGTDPYYASYEKSLSRIQSDVIKLKAQLKTRRALASRIRSRFLGGFAAIWAILLAYAAHVARAPPGTYSARQHAQRMLPAVLSPPLAWILYRLINSILATLDRLTARRLDSLAGKQRKMITELKESTHYERTLRLLQTYDPDYQPPKPAAPPPPASGAGNSSKARPQGTHSRGIVPAVTQLWTLAADKLIADDPVALRLLQEAQRETVQLRTALVASETETLRLQAENRELRSRLGTEELPGPSEESQEGKNAAAERVHLTEEEEDDAILVGRSAGGEHSSSLGARGIKDEEEEGFTQLRDDDLPKKEKPGQKRLV